MFKKMLITLAILGSLNSQAMMTPEFSLGWRIFVGEKVIPLNLAWYGLSKCRKNVVCNVLYWPVRVLAITSLILMDEDNATLKFSKVNAGQLAGITAGEIAVYNNEIEEVNAVVAEFQSVFSKEEDTELIEKTWNEYESYLSPESAKVVQAILKSQIK